MKKYLQACEIGGSIYGKRKKADSNKTPGDDGASEKEDIMASYKKLYRRQIDVMDKVFRHVK